MSAAFDKVAAAIARDPAWRVVSPRMLEGPGKLAVVLDDRHPSTDDFSHVDVGIVVNRDYPASSIAWDCIGYPNEDDGTWLTGSVGRWRATALDTISDMVTHSAMHVEHLDAGNERGFVDYHCVASSGVAYGVGPFDALLEWANGNPVLPVLESAVVERFFDPIMNTLRIVYGGIDQSEVVEVRVNSEFDPSATDALAGLSWPRIEATYLRSYVVCLPQTD